MANKDAFHDQKKRRKAELIIPPNILKKKIGSGGIDDALIAKAQKSLENNVVDFKPIAMGLIDELALASRNAENNATRGEAAVKALLYPAMQLKAQGVLFHFPLVSDISDNLISFLETVDDIDGDVLDIVNVHKMAVSVVITTDMRGPGNEQGRVLKDSLTDVCARYYKTKNNQKA